MNHWSPETYRKAWRFATLAHQGQTYGSSEPGQKVDYINHIGSVAMEVIHAIGHDPAYDADLAIQCALLHDTLEDTTTTYEQLLDHFGQQVADGVQALTKNKSLPTKAAQMEDSLQRIRKQPYEVWMVKMADRITNLYHPPHYWNVQKIKDYREEARQIHHSLRKAHAGLAGRLKEKIEVYQRFILL